MSSTSSKKGNGPERSDNSEEKQPTPLPVKRCIRCGTVIEGSADDHMKVCTNLKWYEEKSSTRKRK